MPAGGTSAQEVIELRNTHETGRHEVQAYHLYSTIHQRLSIRARFCWVCVVSWVGIYPKTQQLVQLLYAGVGVGEGVNVSILLMSS